MSNDALTALRTAYPSHEWRIQSPGLYSGVVPMGNDSALVLVSLASGGFFEAQVVASKEYRAYGTTPVNAVRIALTRAGLRS